ncbi:MAG: hypothetical protein IJX62_04705, partial [Clostridia bacterium]|nr:hypothetical protein [Clostridia bacterium]
GYILAQFLDLIVENAKQKPVPADITATKTLEKLTASLSLHAVTGEADSPWREKLQDVTYRCLENPLGWKRFTLHFDGVAGGTLRYVKASGEMEIPFGINKNVFSKFPEEGYSHLYGGIPSTDGYRYDCAASAAWLDENRLMIGVQIVDLYFGNLCLVFSFRDGAAVLTAEKNAEHFMDDYQGELLAERVENEN